MYVFVIAFYSTGAPDIPKKKTSCFWIQIKQFDNSVKTPSQVLFGLKYLWKSIFFTSVCVFFSTTSIEYRYLSLGPLFKTFKKKEHTHLYKINLLAKKKKDLRVHVLKERINIPHSYSDMSSRALNHEKRSFECIFKPSSDKNPWAYGRVVTNFMFRLTIRRKIKSLNLGTYYN